MGQQRELGFAVQEGWGTLFPGFEDAVWEEEPEAGGFCWGPGANSYSWRPH